MLAEENYSKTWFSKTSNKTHTKIPAYEHIFLLLRPIETYQHFFTNAEIFQIMQHALIIFGFVSNTLNFDDFLRFLSTQHVVLIVSFEKLYLAYAVKLRHIFAYDVDKLAFESFSVWYGDTLQCTLKRVQKPTANKCL